jgi:Cu-Zn family superoxide dismutase
MRLLFCVPLVALLIAGTAAAQDSKKPGMDKPTTVVFKNAEGQTVGTATLSDAPHGVTIKLDITNLPPGEHSMHIHQMAVCDAPDFKSAGPHFGAGAMGHADHDHAAMPAGDIPNFSLFVGKDGTAHAKLVAPNVTLDAGPTSVFSNGGASIVIHAVSDGKSDAAPARIACGVIKKSE